MPVARWEWGAREFLNSAPPPGTARGSGYNRCQCPPHSLPRAAMTHRLMFLPALLFALAPAVRAADAPARPNILWLIAEDLGPELNCFGYTQQVWTPNLDRLAADGVRYTRAYTTAPVCSASRSAFMTGTYQTTIGAHNHRSHRDDGYTLPEGARDLPDLLRDAGYFTANIVSHPAPIKSKCTRNTHWNFNLDH